MLSVETKRKIDNARDVLVGKIPNPQAQIEQITTALIYKFMDDMDEKSKTLGGKARFFVGEYEKYSWRTLLDPRIGGQERMNLYSEAVQRLSQNANLPQIFRDVFKDAFVPYRDPETLSLFLKEINWFDYHHSEELGNAYEYLLSIMGSQGDAGQFRTPRHIIDFIIDVVNPQKNETILDPACGTAGFLISAYKHIIGANDGLDDITGLPKDQEERLKPEERAKMLRNFHGYDIDPGMVRLSLVNMYLHGFVMPNIEEYDSLTYEDRWNDDFDVILANPPFMTPKGGVRPHKRFQIQANRAEVLFVDYIAEHLKPHGRAGIVVPEGIIFQSSNNYKKLRKMLLEESGLWAVVSLPSGVFNPYSPVKTSIIFLDKAKVNTTNDVLFVEVKQTGISLGATNQSVKQNDLHEALKTLREFNISEEIQPSAIAFKVSKKKIAENDTYNLTSGMYKKLVVRSSDIEVVALKDVCNIHKGKSSSTKTEQGDYPLYLTAAESKTAKDYDFNGVGVAVPLISALGHGKAEVKRLHKVSGKFALANLLAFVQPKNSEVINPDYLYYVLNAAKGELAKLMKGAANVGMTTSDLADFHIPLPTLDAQLELVNEINGYQSIINGAMQILSSWVPSINIDSDWKILKLSTLAEIKGGKRIPKGESLSIEPTDHPYIRVVDMNKSTVSTKNIKYLSDDIYKVVQRYTISSDDVYITIAGTIGRTGIVPTELSGSNLTENAAKLVVNQQLIDKHYLAIVLQTPTIQAQIKKFTAGVGIPKLGLQRIAELDIPLPPMHEQQNIVRNIQLEEKILESNQQLLDSYSERINRRLAVVWGE